MTPSRPTYFNAPEHKDEGATKRTNFSLNGPLGGDFSFRLYGNLDKTQADARNINQGHQSERTGSYADTLPVFQEPCHSLPPFLVMILTTPPAAPLP